jgi:hypothetical protein
MGGAPAHMRGAPAEGGGAPIEVQLQSQSTSARTLRTMSSTGTKTG